VSTEPTPLSSREEQLPKAVEATFATATHAIEDMYSTINALVEYTNEIIKERDELKVKMDQTHGLIQQQMDERDTAQRALMVAQDDLSKASSERDTARAQIEGADRRAHESAQKHAGEIESHRRTGDELAHTQKALAELQQKLNDEPEVIIVTTKDVAKIRRMAQAGPTDPTPSASGPV
jgi:chromosome segregation ATPase